MTEEGEQWDTKEGGGDRDSAEEDSEEAETPAPSELARSLGKERPALQRIRLRLHGHDNVQGIAHKLQAFLMWVSLKVTHMDVADPVVFLSNVGGGEGEGGHRANRKPKRESLTSLQTPRFHQGTLNFGEERREPEGASEGGEEEGEGEQRGRARPRTNLGIGDGVAGSEGGRGSKRKSELSSSQAFSWRQLSLNFGGGSGVGGKPGGEGEEEGDSRGQARARTSQLEPSMELTRPEPAPGTDRSDGRGPPSGLV